MPVEDFAEQLRTIRNPYGDLMGLVIDSANVEEVRASLVLDPEKHMQPFGIVHGGVYATIAETLASLGAALSAAPAGRNAVGLENHTSFLRAVRGGRIEAVANAVYRGNTTHVWTIEMSGPDGRLVARSTVRMALPELRE